MESINNEEIRERREINKGQREGGKMETYKRKERNKKTRRNGENM
jgi:hypothetical protein